MKNDQGGLSKVIGAAKVDKESIYGGDEAIGSGDVRKVYNEDIARMSQSVMGRLGAMRLLFSGDEDMRGMRIFNLLDEPRGGDVVVR